jgi:hypothetical protein
MKLHHTAALAVAGWYLIMPPLGSDGRRDDSAPLPQWKIRGSFDTAVECVDALAEQLGSDLPEMVRQTILASRCISTDDPQLKGN